MTTTHGPIASRRACNGRCRTPRRLRRYDEIDKVAARRFPPVALPHPADGSVTSHDS